MILAGDIGGTKTVLALFERARGIQGEALFEARFASARYNSLEEIIAEFLGQTGLQPTVAGFGVAGPVKEQQAKITNLPWRISAANIRQAFRIPQVFLLNDLQAVAVAVPYLRPEDTGTLNDCVPTATGNIVVIAPGTGLGISFLIWNGSGYTPCASEAGHASFSPRTPQQIQLLQYLQERYGHVSFERVCSGAFLPNIFDFLRERQARPVPAWLEQELAGSADRTPVIIHNALEHKAPICETVLDIFVQILGTVAGNMAVTLLPSGGIYLGGGIPPRIFQRLRQADFQSAITDKGRFSDLLATMPVRVILNPRTALQGAAWHGLQQMTGS